MKGKSAIQMLCDKGHILEIKADIDGYMIRCANCMNAYETYGCDVTPELAASRLLRSVRMAEINPMSSDITVQKRLATRRASRRAKV